jgi:acyl dehydratase
VPIDAAYVGRVYPPSAPYEVGREKIREFADAIGDPNPVYRDRDAARAQGQSDVVAPPTFAMIISTAAARQLIDDPDLGIDFARVVHGDQRFTYTRPICAGDQLVAVVTITNVRAVAGIDMITSSTEIVTVDGEPVVTAVSTLVVRSEDTAEDTAEEQ